MAKFKCKHSGTVIEFINEWDIEGMRAHTEYEEVVEESAPVQEPVEQVKPEVKRGRKPAQK
jgi:hypothetical protein